MAGTGENIAGGVSLPLSLVKQHLRVNHSHDDALIMLYLSAAQGFFEGESGTKISDYSPLPDDIKVYLLSIVATLYQIRANEMEVRQYRPSVFRKIIFPYIRYNPGIY